MFVDPFMNLPMFRKSDVNTFGFFFLRVSTNMDLYISEKSTSKKKELVGSHCQCRPDASVLQEKEKKQVAACPHQERQNEGVPILAVHPDLDGLKAAHLSQSISTPQQRPPSASGLLLRRRTSPPCPPPPPQPHRPPSPPPHAADLRRRAESRRPAADPSSADP